MQDGLRKLATDRGLNISDSARLFAAVETTIADSAGTIWNAKLQYMWWRPVTAIQMGATDGNPLTDGRRELDAAHHHPAVSRLAEWPVGVVGSVTTVLTQINGDGRVDLTVHSNAANEDPLLRVQGRHGPDRPSTRGCGAASTSAPPTRCRSTSAPTSPTRC